MGDPLVDLRAAVAPHECVRGPNPIEGGAGVVIRIGAATEVTVELSASGRATAAADSPDAAPLYVDLDLDALGAVRVRTSDPGFAAALVGGLDARLRRALAVGGSARLGFGRWQIVRPRAGVPLREIAETVALLAARPAAIGRDWSAAARALDATVGPRWTPRGDAAFMVGDVELAHRLAGDGPHLRTEAIRRGRAASMDERAIRIGDREGAIVIGAERTIAWLSGLVVDPVELAALIGQVTGAAPPVHATAASAPAVAPMAFADWPSRRELLSTGVARDRIWIVRSTTGRDPARGLDEEVEVDGVAVRTTCDDSPRAATRIRAAAPGADGLTIAARPGYRFLRGWFWPDPQLGDRDFDDRYVLATDDLAWTRWWLGPTERAAIAATFAPEASHPFGFALDAAAVTFSAAALPGRHVADAARQAAAFLATRGERATAEWRDLAGPLGATVIGDRFGRGGGLALRTGRGAIAIELAAITGSDGRLATRAAVTGAATDGDRGPHLALRADRAPDGLDAARGRRDPSIRILRGAANHPGGYDARTTDPAWASARIAALAPLLAVARPDLVEIDGPRASVTWAGPILDATRLAGGVDLIARAVRESAGAPAPYR